MRVLFRSPRDNHAVSLADETYAYRGRLPHLVRRERLYFVTFCTSLRRCLPPGARTLTLAFCARDHERNCWVDCVIVMPDHVHMILMPYEETSLAAQLNRIKGGSAFAVNRLLGRSGSIWQRESFDRIIRSDENLDKKRQYIFDNSVRKGL